MINHESSVDSNEPTVATEVEISGKAIWYNERGEARVIPDASLRKSHCENSLHNTSKYIECSQTLKKMSCFCYQKKPANHVKENYVHKT
jgi:hypothetical protein